VPVEEGMILWRVHEVWSTSGIFVDPVPIMPSAVNVVVPEREDPVPTVCDQEEDINEVLVSFESDCSRVLVS